MVEYMWIRLSLTINMPRTNGKITHKQKLFVKEYIKTKGNGTLSALRVYDTKNYNTAHAIGSENLTKLTVKEELEKALKRNDLTVDKLTSKLTEITEEKPAKGYSGSDIIQAITTGLKLHGVLTERKTVTNYNLNANFKEMSVHELRQLRTKKQQETDNILNDVS